MIQVKDNRIFVYMSVYGLILALVIRRKANAQVIIQIDDLNQFSVN